MPRKTAGHRPALRLGLLASMRPRPDAAENHPGAPAPTPPTPEASMRPRPDAAENLQTAAADTKPPLLQ